MSDLKQTTSPQRILLIDLQEDWRERSASELRGAGYQVVTSANYDYPSHELLDPETEESDRGRRRTFDLIILGCAHIGAAEQRLITRAHRLWQWLLVLPTSFSWSETRRAFLAGAQDVANKPYDAAHLLDLVEQTLVKETEAIAPYEAVREEESWQAQSGF